MFSEIKALVQKDYFLDLRSKTALAGLLLYILSTMFTCYLSFHKIVDVPSWNALFWIIILFASINAAARSFMGEHRSVFLYYYNICSPNAFVLAKIIYNWLLIVVLALIGFVVYILFMGNPVQDLPMFLLVLIIGSGGLSSALTIVSAIASKAGNNFTLMAILSFPLLIPFLITLIKVSKNAIDGINRGLSIKYIVLLLLIKLILISLSYLLFPYLWRD